MQCQEDPPNPPMPWGALVGLSGYQVLSAYCVSSRNWVSTAIA